MAATHGWEPLLLGRGRHRRVTGRGWQAWQDPCFQGRVGQWKKAVAPLSLMCWQRAASVCHGLPWWLSGEESSCPWRGRRFHPCVRKITWRRAWRPTAIFLPGGSHEQKSLAEYSPWSRRVATEHACKGRKKCIVKSHLLLSFTKPYFGGLYLSNIVFLIGISTNAGSSKWSVLTATQGPVAWPYCGSCSPSSTDPRVSSLWQHSVSVPCTCVSLSGAWLPFPTCPLESPKTLGENTALSGPWPLRIVYSVRLWWGLRIFCLLVLVSLGKHSRYSYYHWGIFRKVETAVLNRAA